MSGLNPVPHLAIVSRRAPTQVAEGLYLRLNNDGPANWTDDPEEATAFESMREAMRAATRLPSALRAYGVPLQAERLVGRDLH